ncbi:MAG: hypothetical protein RR949_08760, partial [Oscillospiraceae bacterium]
MIRKQSFLDTKTGVELVLPIPPASYSWEHAINMEIVNIDGLGDVDMPGRGVLDSEQISCLFPSHRYPWVEAGASIVPHTYIYQLERWVDAGTVLRYIVSGTPTNAAVRLTGIKYTENDGTNDISAVISLKQHRTVGVLQGPAAVTPPQRDTGTAATVQRSYCIKKGDTLWGIARK